MVSVRLTKTLRDTIRGELMRRAYKERRADIKERENSLAMEVYNAAYTERQRSIMAELGPDFFPHSSVARADFHHDYGELSFGKDMIISDHHDNGWRRAMVVFKDTDPIVDKYRQFKKDKAKLKEDLEQKKAEVTGILEACTTIKKLVEYWLELEPLLPELGIRIEKAPVFLPAIRADINDVFKLPPSEQEEKDKAGE